MPSVTGAQAYADSLESTRRGASGAYERYDSYTTSPIRSKPSFFHSPSLDHKVNTRYHENLEVESSGDLATDAVLQRQNIVRVLDFHKSPTRAIKIVLHTPDRANHTMIPHVVKP